MEIPPKSFAEYRGTFVLIAIVFLLLGVTAIDGSNLGRYVSQGLFLLVIIALVNAATGESRIRYLVFVFAALWLVLNVLFLASGNVHNLAASDAIALCLLGLTVTTGVKRLFMVRQANADLIATAIANYLLLALLWAVSYRLSEYLVPGSVGAATDQASLNYFLYFSLTTITTLGYGDITPVSDFARTWATLEAVTGQVYVAVLVARLVTLLRS